AVDMPYGSGDFSMTVLLPRRGKAIDAFIAGFSADSLALWFGSMQKSERMLQFPKFKLEYEIEMTDVLSGLGMGIAFSDRADFTRILKIGGLKIDGVKHKTFVDVNEEGTEAAAVTSISFATSMPAFFRADRPFLYLIREKHSGSILFIGKVVDPTK
ncbi:MAG TPA: serpin family protein, partial [bacterium]